MKTRFKFTPWDAVRRAGGCYGKHYDKGEWIVAYQWFCQKLKLWSEMQGKLRTPWEWLNKTSGIHNTGPHPIVRDVYRTIPERLADLFLHVGDRDKRGEFLEWLGLAQITDLQKPITIVKLVPGEFPHQAWFEMAGRIFKVSPNQYHPKATFVTHCQIGFSPWIQKWSVSLIYSYPHESSSWGEGVTQEDGETLDELAARFDAMCEELLTPDDHFRQSRERAWSDVYSAFRDLFWCNISPSLTGSAEKIADSLCEMRTGGSLSDHRILLTPERLATIKSWIRETKRHYARKAKQREKAAKGRRR